MIRELSCKNCGKVFQAPRNDAKWCPACKKLRMREGSSTVCPICGGIKYVTSKKCQTCENRVRIRIGPDNWNWKGGTTRAQGYLFIRQGAGLNAKYVPEHRLVWEQTHGAIPEGFVIHHLNGIKQDNRIENLACLPIAAHSGPAIHQAYKARIRQLEAQVKTLQTQLQGNML